MHQRSWTAWSIIVAMSFVTVADSLAQVAASEQQGSVS